MNISALSAQDMTTYLKNVVETESSLFRQKMVQQEAQSCLCYKAPEKGNIKKPQLEEIPKPKEAKQVPKIGENLIAVILTILGAVGCCCGIWCLFQGFMMFVAGLCALFFAGLMGWLGIFCLRSIPEAKKDAARYAYEMRVYERKAAEAKEEYAQAMSAYQQKKEAEEQRYSLAVSAAEECYQTAKQQVEQLDKPIEETETVLQNLYDLGIIFPKYRNLPAICMFYEYFASGRCTELTGPNGAYNLYEAELRQNLIINKLDAIMGSLESIKQNQFILYTEIQKTANALPKISRDITCMLDTSQQLSQSAAITAQCAEATKTNTDILTYLALVKH